MSDLLDVMADLLDGIDDVHVLYRQSQAVKKDLRELASRKDLTPEERAHLKKQIEDEQDAANDYLHIEEQYARRFRYLDLKGNAEVAKCRLPETEPFESIESIKQRLDVAREGRAA